MLRFPIINRMLVCVLLFSPLSALACACGCGVFDIQTDTLLPAQEGGTAWIDYNFINQHTNWHHFSSAPAGDNEDKVVRTHFITLGAQYMFNRSWGASVEVPYVSRYFHTTDEDTGDNASFRNSNIGDVRLKGRYTGFSETMSTGLTFGVKLPSGDYNKAGFDRDTAIGTGSTDILLGAYHFITLPHNFGGFVTAELAQPFLTTAGYRPGAEINAAGGLYYSGWAIGNARISPLAQVIGSYHASDRGPAAAPDETGYKRILLSPGIEVAGGGWHLYSSIALPVVEYVKGNQLIASELYKITLSHDF